MGGYPFAIRSFIRSFPEERNNSAQTLLQTVTGRRTLRCAEALHPWVSPKVSLVDLHTTRRSRRDGDTKTELCVGCAGGPREHRLACICPGSMTTMIQGGICTVSHPPPTYLQRCPFSRIPSLSNTQGGVLSA